MNKAEFLEIICKNAKDYCKGDVNISIHKNLHMNEIEVGEIIQKRHIEAVLVGYLNFVGAKQGIDLAMYTSDL